MIANIDIQFVIFVCYKYLYTSVPFAFCMVQFQMVKICLHFSLNILVVTTASAAAATTDGLICDRSVQK